MYKTQIFYTTEIKGGKKGIKEQSCILQNTDLCILWIYTTAAAFDQIINTYSLGNASLNREAHFKDLGHTK